MDSWPGGDRSLHPTDRRTVRYFDTHEHHYGRSRIHGVARVVGDRLGPGSRIVDVGCGTGDNLRLLARRLGVTDVTAVDVSASSLAKVAEVLPEATRVCMSLLDEDALRPWQASFDGVVVAAVLHHLVGSTRTLSRRKARLGLSHAASLLAPGGLLIVLEPTFSPRPLVGALFWGKRVVTCVTSDRVAVGGYWHNIGAPVVSFYSHDEVRRMVEDTGLTIVAEQVEARSVGRLDRVFSKADSTFVAVR